MAKHTMSKIKNEKWQIKKNIWIIYNKLKINNKERETLINQYEGDSIEK